MAVMTFMDRDTIPAVIERLAETNYKPLKLYVIDYGSKKIAKIVDILQKKIPSVYKADKSKKGSCLKERPKYIVLTDDDIIVARAKIK